MGWFELGGLEEEVNEPEFATFIAAAENALAVFNDAMGNMFRYLMQINKKSASAGLLQTPANLLDIPPEELTAIKDSGSLIDRIAIHYQRLRPMELMLNGEPIRDMDYYSLAVAARALGLAKPISLSIMASPSKGYEIIIENRQLSGYEIIRRHLRPYGKIKFKDLAYVVDTFKISENVAKKLLSLKVLRKIDEDGTQISGESIRELYELVFPRKNKDRYNHVAQLLRQEQTAQPAVAGAEVGKGDGTPQTVLDDKSYKGGRPTYIPLSRIPSNLKRVTDYELVPDSPTQNPDAYYIRHTETRLRAQTEKPTINVNSIDVARLLLATVYLAWNNSFGLEENKARLKEVYGYIPEQRQILAELGDCGMPAILYNKLWRISPGGVEILLLPREEREKIAAKAKPFITKYGPYVSFREAKEFLGNNLTSQDLIHRRIKTIIIDGIIKYNTFQVVHAYYDKISARK